MVSRNVFVCIWVCVFMGVCMENTRTHTHTHTQAFVAHTRAASCDPGKVVSPTHRPDEAPFFVGSGLRVAVRAGGEAMGPQG